MCKLFPAIHWLVLHGWLCLQVVFEGIVGRSYTSDMAIDDVRLEPSCPPLGITKQPLSVPVWVWTQLWCGAAYPVYSMKMLRNSWMWLCCFVWNCCGSARMWPGHQQGCRLLLNTAVCWSELTGSARMWPGHQQGCCLLLNTSVCWSELTGSRSDWVTSRAVVSCWMLLFVAWN